MLILRGAAALSGFRRQKLLSTLTAKLPEVTSVYADFIHFAELGEGPDGRLSDSELDTLDALLTYGPRASSEEPEGELFLVVPRPGTISPWASKATDIAHNAGLEKIQRLERGIAYYVEVDSDGVNRQAIADLLHDRMVESVFSTLEAGEQLFRHEQPQP
ncbi:MAG: phosphoribosylformylglycinamidine synthase, partial [Porticoccaceae bacterium]|nr:phosphoribosylformylglycinamidine synthase [Porticoccaceae bacterium]